MTQRMSDMLQLVVDVRNGLPAMELESPVSRRQAEAYRTFVESSRLTCVLVI